jgi:hypothetical protein
MTEQLRRSAAQLAGEPVIVLEPVVGGANSRVFRVTTPSRVVALKHYVRRTGNTRDRLAVEWNALAFLRQEGLDHVPIALARDCSRRLLLMEWIDGRAIAQHTWNDLDVAIDFMARIFTASQRPDAAGFPRAHEACLSATEILRQIELRLASLMPDAMLNDFLVNTFHPCFAAARAALADEIVASKDLPVTLQRLIPADFGFHNALRASDGCLRFFDFEYFGWDDPVKMAADFVLHPGMSLAETEKLRVVQRLAAAVPADSGFADRFARHKPFYALRWALIILNPFRRDRTAERPRSPAAQYALFERRLAMARLMCDRLAR